MSEMDTSKPVVFTGQAATGEIRRWYSYLQERYHHDGGNGRAWRAELRRCAQPYGALTTESFQVLMQSLRNHVNFQPSDTLALAIFASVVAHARKDNPQECFARQLGKEHKSTPYLSRLRFDRLLAIRTPTELCSQLTRAVKLRGDEGVNVVSLADGIFQWMREWHAREQCLPAQSDPFKRISVRWASEYLQAKEKVSVKH